MVRFQADRFCNLSAQFKWMQSEEATQFLGFNVGYEETRMSQDRLRMLFVKVAEDLKAIECKTSAAMALHLAMDVQLTTTREALVARIDYFLKGAVAEMSDSFFFWVPTHRATYFDTTHLTFGDDVANRFVNVLTEIKRAGNCFATNNPTACVFHLMRVMESGLKAIGASLQIKMNLTESWEQILRRITPEEIKKDSTANAIMLANLVFYQNVRGTLCAVKDSVRNPTMHLDRSYSETEALEIMALVRGFMKCVAGKIDENGTLV